MLRQGSRLLDKWGIYYADMGTSTELALMGILFDKGQLKAGLL